jgi:hypothetical protein
VAPRFLTNEYRSLKSEAILQMKREVLVLEVKASTFPEIK